MAGILSLLLCGRTYLFLYILIYPAWTLSMDIIININTTDECLQPLVCKQNLSGQSSSWSLIISPYDLFAVGKSVQLTERSLILLSSLSPCQFDYFHAQNAENIVYNMCSFTCSTFFAEQRHVFLHSAYNTKNTNRQSLFNILINANRNWDSISKIISLLHSRYKWTKLVVFTSSDEELSAVYTGVQSSLSSVILFAGDESINDTLDNVYSLLEKNDLNFIIACSAARIMEFLHQAYLYETLSGKVSNKWLLIPTSGSVRDVASSTLQVPKADIVVLDFKTCREQHIMASGVSPQDFISSIDRDYSLTEKTILHNASLITASVYTLHRDRSIRHVGHISSDGDVRITEDLFPGFKYGFNNQTFKVGTLEWPPFVFKREENGSVKYSGVCIDILEDISAALNFSYHIVEPEDQEWGRELNGRWTGLIGDLAYEKVDLVAAPIAILEAREQVMDFTVPYFYIKSGIILKQRDDNTTKWMTLVAPFRYEVHICILFSLIFSTVFLFAVEEIHPVNVWPDNRPSARRTRYGDILWYHFGALMANGGAYLPNTQSGRTVLSCWWLFTVISAAIYSGNLIAFLTDWRQKPPFTSLEGMVEQDTYKWGVVGGSFYITLFENSKIPTVMKLWREMQGEPYRTSLNMTQHKMTVLEEKYAYLGDETVMELWSSEYCGLQFLEESFFLLNYALALPNNSLFTDVFSNEVLRLNEIGLPRVWYKRWIRHFSVHCETSRSAKKVDLLALQSAFYAAGVGVLLALSVLVAEVMFNRKWRQFKLADAEDSSLSHTEETSSSLTEEKSLSLTGDNVSRNLQDNEDAQ